MPFTLWKWRRAQKRLKKAERDDASATHSVKDASRRHRAKYPLDGRTQDAIIRAYCDGKPLCCEEGQKLLYKLGLDACWAEHINNWAYEHLGCAEFYKPKGNHHERGLSKLCKFLEKGADAQ
jgi:hypothetical protein